MEQELDVLLEEYDRSDKSGAPKEVRDEVKLSLLRELICLVRYQARAIDKLEDEVRELRDLLP